MDNNFQSKQESVFNVGDIARFKGGIFGYRVFNVGDEVGEHVMHIWINAGYEKVNVCDMEKVADIRFDHISSCLDEWFKLTQDVKLMRLNTAIKSHPTTEWHECFLVEINKGIQLFDVIAFQANELLAKGVRHWGMKTIYEYLRHMSAIADSSVEFKINNNTASGMARLMKIMFPEIGELFSFRNSLCNDDKVA